MNTTKMDDNSGNVFPPVSLIKALDGYTEPGTIPRIIANESKGHPTVAPVNPGNNEEVINDLLCFAERRGLSSEESMLQAKKSSTSGCTLSHRWVVESVVRGDGSIFGGKQLMKDKIYGSSQARCAHENFNEIERDEVIFRGYGDCAIRFPSYAVKNKKLSGRVSTCNIPQKEDMQETRSSVRISRQQVVADSVLSFLRRNPGTAVIITRIGARGPSQGLNRLHVVAAGPLFAQSNEWPCVKASVLNAVRALRGQEAAIRARNLLEKDSTFFNDFKPLGVLVHKLGIKVTIKKVDKRDRKRLRNANRESFKWFSGKLTGVWLLRLVQNCVVDHCIAVDASRGLIFDSAEKYPLPLSEKALFVCGGVSATKLRIEDVRELVEQ